jgi:hypothetical protein
LREAAVLIRPHPYNLGSWTEAEFDDDAAVSVWPNRQVSIVDEDNRRDYFDSLFHARAVVGINTSAMVEAAVVGRPVLSVLTSEFRDRQEGSLHFQYLRRDGGGCVLEASSLSEHLRQLSRVLAGARPENVDFVRSFVRPHGLEQAATPRVADAIEQTASVRVPHRTSATAFALRPFVWLAGTAIDWATPERRRRIVRLAVRRLARLLRNVARRVRAQSARQGSS